MDDLSSGSETETDLDVIIEAAVTNDNSDDDLIYFFCKDWVAEGRM